MSVDDHPDSIQQPQSTDEDAPVYRQRYHLSELDLHTTLAPKYGGPLDPECIDEALLINETKDDLELREQILLGRVPLIDTIFRYVTS